MPLWETKIGDTATAEAVAVPSQRLPVSSRPSNHMASAVATPASTNPGRWSPVAASEPARMAGHSGWYLNTIRSPAMPDR